MAPTTFSASTTVITTPCLHMPEEGCPYNSCLFYWIISYGNIPPKWPHIFVIKAMLQNYVKYVEREWECKREREGSLVRFSCKSSWGRQKSSANLSGLDQSGCFAFVHESPPLRAATILILATLASMWASNAMLSSRQSDLTTSHHSCSFFPFSFCGN